jgi:hypothetical protein
MTFLVRVFATLIGISTVMLTCSLVVMCLVRVLQYLANMRGKTVGEMLAAMNQGFRFNQGDAASPSDEPQLSFMLDVLSYPALHEPAALIKVAARSADPKQRKGLQEQLAKSVEYLSKQDLIAIVRSMLETRTTPAPEGLADPDGDRPLPSRWSRSLPPQARKFADFVAYVEHWYMTLDALGTEQFKTKARRLTATVSCLLVVFMNLDGLQLATDIFEDSSLRASLGEQAPQVLARADYMGAKDAFSPTITERDALLRGVGETTIQANGILNEPQLGFGWQESKIVKMWCACKAGGPCPSASQRSLGVLRWLAGLTFSCLLLSLGAPFWSDRLRDLLSLRNNVQRVFTTGPNANEGRSSGSEKKKPKG